MLLQHYQSIDPCWTHADTWDKRRSNFGVIIKEVTPLNRSELSPVRFKSEFFFIFIVFYYLCN